MSSDTSYFKYAALVSYRGGKFCGWQKQLGSDSGTEPSIQQTIEQALAEITSEEKISVVGSGRTDAGVHAIGQVAHFALRSKEWDTGILQKGLNSKLRPSIQVVHVKRVDSDFHAQRSAEKKQYSYYFQQGPCALPHLEPYSWWIKKRLNLEAMQEAVGALRGEHDFKPFQARGAKVTTTVRKILEADVTWQPISFPSREALKENELGLVRVRLVGTGFLKQMVRGIAGTLLEIGENRRPATDIKAILKSGDRSEVGQTAPGRALWLEQVWYPNLDF